MCVCVFLAGIVGIQFSCVFKCLLCMCVCYKSLCSFISACAEWSCTDRKLGNRNRKLLWLLICLMSCRGWNVPLCSGDCLETKCQAWDSTHTHIRTDTPDDCVLCLHDLSELWCCSGCNCCSVSLAGLKAQLEWVHVFAVCLRLDRCLRGDTVMSVSFLLTESNSLCVFTQTLVSQCVLM